jgi:MFS family permease
LTTVLAAAPLLCVLVTWNVVTLATAAANVAEVVLAKVVFGAGDVGFGLLVGAAGAGLALGSMLAARQIDRRGVTAVYVGAILLMGLGLGAAALAPAVGVAAVAVAVAGAGNGAAVVCNAVVVQRGAPDALRGRVFAVLMCSTNATLAVGMAGGGVLTDAVGARWTWGGAAMLVLLGAGLALRLAGRGDSTQALGRGAAARA